MVTPAELNRRAEIYNQLGSMLAAGLPLVKALEMVSSKSVARSSHKTISGLIENLQAGYTFTDSMRQVQGWLSEFDVALLSAGEESGRLDVSFKLLSNYYATRAKIIRDTISGLLITIATLHVFLLVFPTGLLTLCASGIIYGRYADCLPFIVEKVIAFGSLYGIVFFLIYACGGKRGTGWRSVMEALFDMIPFLRTAQKNLALSRLTAALDALTNAGVNTTKSWELAAAATGSPRLNAEISGWKEQIEGGMTPADLINQTRYFPELFANLYQTGEISGKLDETLQRLSLYYEEEGFRALRLFTRLLNGTIYSLVVLLVAINIIGFYKNYYGAAIDGM
ncbi:MAG TPA: type II secretion system F family protein [Verrucomicrobiae bacterium]|jgi:type IV pilus assembly protein PilC